MEVLRVLGSQMKAKRQKLLVFTLKSSFISFFRVLNKINVGMAKFCRSESFSLIVISFCVHVSFNTWLSTSCFQTTFTVNINFFPQKMFFLVMKTCKIHLIKILITAWLVRIKDTNMSWVYEGSLNIRCFLA